MTIINSDSLNFVTKYKYIKLKKKYNTSLVFLALFSIIMIAMIYFVTGKEQKLPIYNPVDVNPLLVDSGVKHINRGHKIADFSLINQNGDTITQNDYEDKIYVADFFFTRCGTICPKMAKNMAILQQKFLEDQEVRFLSMSVTPVMDSVPQLKKYAKEKGVNAKKWNVTTGKKTHIYALARKSFMAVLDEGDGGVQDFIHTEQFVLVDKKKQIRGYYDGTDAKDMERIIDDILLLQAEE